MNQFNQLLFLLTAQAFKPDLLSSLEQLGRHHLPLLAFLLVLQPELGVDSSRRFRYFSGGVVETFASASIVAFGCR